MNNQKTIHDPPPKIGSKVIITKNSFNKFSLGDICIRTKSGFPLNLFTVRSKEGLEQLVDWDDCQPYTELLNSKEENKMEQKIKWYKPWTWFNVEDPFASARGERGEKMDEIAKDHAQELAVKMGDALTSGFGNPMIPSKILDEGYASTYTPPRNISKKKAVKKTVSKKKAAKKKRGKK